MTVDVTVITPTMPGRERFLGEAKRSVLAQSEQPKGGHLVRCEAPPETLGPNPGHLAHQRNELLHDVTTSWVACLDDDDLWLPEHLETIATSFEHADVVYTWPTKPVIHVVDVTGWSSTLIAEQLRAHNFIPSAAAIRVDVLHAHDGWSERFDPISRRFPSGCVWEDWDLWLRLAEAGRRFVCVPAMTWEYRVHDDQSSRRWEE